jgi:hypothetical protein
MKKIENFDKINEAGEYKALPPQPYVVRLTNVVDVVDKEYLEIYFDIIEPAEFKGHFKELYDATGKDYSKTIRSYKNEAAMSYFKQFTTAVNKSNPGFLWEKSWNEKDLIGKVVIANFGEEEYDDGVSDEIKVSTKVQQFRSGSAYREGKIELLPRKKLTDEQLKKFEERVDKLVDKRVATAVNASSVADINEDDLPF